jgi:hypothetical protein
MLSWPFPALGAKKALLIGVEHHCDGEANHLPGVTEDIRLLSGVLSSKAGFSRENQKILLDRQATKENVVKAFDDWLIKGTKPGDTALFYFSGHGTQVWDENGHEIQDGKAKILICYDTRLVGPEIERSFRNRISRANDIKDTVNALLGDELHRLLSQLKDRTVIFVSDSCHSGTVYKSLGNRNVITKNFRRPMVFKGILEKRVSESVNKSFEPDKPYINSDLTIHGVRLAAFTACENSQQAEVKPFSTEPVGEHSVFSWYLYHALQGKADVKGEGKITFASLAKYIEESIKRDGYSQVPQAEFQPSSIADDILEAQVNKTQDQVRAPQKIGFCFAAGTGISSSERDRACSAIVRNIPAFQLNDEKKDNSVYLVMEKRGKSYLAQISDPTGAIWEKQEATDFEAAVKKVLGNLRAYYIQTILMALRNPSPKADLDFSYRVKGKPTRATGEVLKGDTIIINALTKSSGYLYVFGVDTEGVIHPLYPMPKSKPEKLKPGHPATIGSDDSYSIQPPLGKEMMFAFLLPNQPGKLSGFWDKDDIGDSRTSGVVEQDRFLDALWSELIESGKPKGDWVSQVLWLKSFEQ